MTSFRIRGPVEVSAGGSRLPMGGRRQLTLLAFLVVHADRAVSSEVVIDALWGPARSGADNRLQMAVARLRKALRPLDRADGPVLQTVSGGYRPCVAPGQLDAEVFAARVGEGRRVGRGRPRPRSRALG